MPSTEALEIRALAREFATGELRPHSAEWDAARELPADIFRKLAELGFLGMRIPDKHGGLALDLPTYLLALESLAWGDAAVALGVAVHSGPVTEILLRKGSEEQKARWLPAMAAGECFAAFALSEPEAGSDASAVALDARRTGDEWELNGTKRWISNGDRADLILLFARSSGTPGERDGISAFLLPRDTPGIRVAGRDRTLGLSASETVTLELEGVKLPDSARIGEEGTGYRMAMDGLVVGRMGIAAQALGIAQSAYEHALRYSAEREQFGRALATFGGIQEKLAGMAIRIAGARALMLDVAARMEGEERGTLDLPASPRAASAMAKVAASEAAMWVTDEAVQIFGGYGYMRDYPVEKLMRDAKGTEIYEGANEVLRMVVSIDAIRESQE